MILDTVLDLPTWVNLVVVDSITLKLESGDEDAALELSLSALDGAIEDRRYPLNRHINGDAPQTVRGVAQ
jgi:hypothetical protein